MQKEIRRTWHFSQPLQDVWEYLTNPELLELWLMKTNFLPIVGHKFQFTCSSIAYCEVLEVVPFVKLTYTWQTDSVSNGKPFHSTVEWTLIPAEGGTELQLVHKGFITLEDYLGHNRGWTATGDKLTEMLSEIERSHLAKK